MSKRPPLIWRPFCFKLNLMFLNPLPEKTLLAALLASTAMSSCKRDYVCHCKDNDVKEPYDFSTKYKLSKKKDAEQLCDAQNKVYAPDWSCVLK